MGGGIFQIFIFPGNFSLKSSRSRAELHLHLLNAHNSYRPPQNTPSKTFQLYTSGGVNRNKRQIFIKEALVRSQSQHHRSPRKPKSLLSVGFSVGRRRKFPPTISLSLLKLVLPAGSLSTTPLFPQEHLKLSGPLQQNNTDTLRTKDSLSGSGPVLLSHRRRAL